MNDDERACISHWYPRIEDLPGVPTPETAIIETDVDLLSVIDGKTPEGFYRLIEKLKEAALEISENGPWFLRTGVFSGKHNWEHTCFLRSTLEMVGQVAELVEQSQVVDLLGLPTNVWAVREFIPLDVHFHAFRGNMPIATEARVFFRNGRVTCVHPYWPFEAFDFPDGVVDGWIEHARMMDHVRSMDTKVRDDQDILTSFTEEFVAPQFGDEWWSVDWARDTDGLWWLTDMAPGERSWHPDSCPWRHG